MTNGHEPAAADQALPARKDSFRRAPMSYYDMYVKSGLVRENGFLGMPPEERALPSYAEAAELLPRPHWEGRETELGLYWKAWELAFGHLRKANARNGFPANYIDTAFNNDLFMYDSSFILLYGMYGRRAFDFQRTLDNFYAKQHPDGFICRQIRQTDGTDVFHRFDPSSTGPNLMPWTEWEYFRMSSDTERLANVFPALVAYHRWLKAYRTWPDGTYWANGWSGAADNLPRIPDNADKDKDYFFHGHLVWCDSCIFQVYAAKLLVAMAGVLGREAEVADVAEEAEKLTALINDRLWDEETAFYYDMLPDGTLTGVKNIGAYWALLADIVPARRMERFVSHLSDPGAFNRPHRVPSLSADHPAYRPEGDYWVGAVWMPTNYMVLGGLRAAGFEALAEEIAANHLDQVTDVYAATGTIWENYAPEQAAPGKPAKPDFVGWGGLAPIAVLFEYRFGLRPDAPASRLAWDVRLLEAHGVARYPFGAEGVLDLACAARGSRTERPRIEARSNVALTLIVRWDGGEETIALAPEGGAGGNAAAEAGSAVGTEASAEAGAAARAARESDAGPAAESESAASAETGGGHDGE
ncbi:Trehalase [Paenibacillus sp. UNC496MF]|uniref:MGH1-like glycoside hydrolase domain-containing protein n=1 Tax=Paenibacillus sp. UNC496MF TaxID=1502753 RepID=UPI0008F4415D|nr:trehalase family glycosidase [Paenibacillus sp. UNC496MF]SFJ80324.1 Trehalase [Paenibacillus sp. UNC496MF]